MLKIDLSTTGLFLLGVISTVVLIVLDKAGKLKGSMLLVLLGVAAILTLPLALSVSWVSDTQGVVKFSRGLLMFFLIGVAYSLIAVWVTPVAPASPTPPAREKQEAPKPVFQVTAPTLFTGLLKLDVNVFRKISGPDVVEGFFPVILTLENLPTSGFGETDTVWAQISYKQNGMELERVSTGCWVDEPLPDITFPFRTPRYLVIGGWHTKHKTPTPNDFKMVEYSRQLHRAVEHPHSMASPRTLVVEVVLTPNGHHEASREYKFILELVGPALFKFFELKQQEQKEQAGNEAALRLAEYMTEGGQILSDLMERRILGDAQTRADVWAEKVEKYLDSQGMNTYALRFKSPIITVYPPGGATSKTRPLVDWLFTRITRLEEFVREMGRQG